MSGSSSKSRSSSRSSSRSYGRSSSSTDVWGDQAGYLNQLYEGASADLATPREYGANRYAGIGAGTRQAIGASAGTFARNEENIDAASTQFQDTMAGRYLDPESNPYLQAQFDVGARGIRREFLDATQALGSRAEASGRSGSPNARFRQGRNAEALATGLADFSAKLYGENYGRERGIMAGMTDQAQSIAGAGFQNVAGLSQMGDREQLDRQSQLDDQNQRFQFNQERFANQLAQFRDLIGGPTMTSDAMSVESSMSKSRSKSRGKQASGGL